MSDEPWFSPDITVPGGWQTADFSLRPLTVADCDLDFDAVISSRNALLKRSQGYWPREGFTWQENYDDLHMHQEEHNQRAAFTFTMMAPDESRCLGCVYINPLRQALIEGGLDPEMAAEMPDLAAKVSFWVRPDQDAEGLDRRLLAALQQWFADEWPFPAVFYEASKLDTAMQALLGEGGLLRRYALHYDHRSLPYYLYG